MSPWSCCCKVESPHQIIRLICGKTSRHAGLGHCSTQAEVPWALVMQEASERFSFPHHCSHLAKKCRRWLSEAPVAEGLPLHEPQQPRPVAQFRVGCGYYKFVKAKTVALYGAASHAAETLDIGHTFSFRLSRAWRRVKGLVWIRGWGVHCLTSTKLSIAGKILGMNKISIQGEDGTCRVLRSNLGVTEEKKMNEPCSSYCNVICHLYCNGI